MPPLLFLFFCLIPWKEQTTKVKWYGLPETERQQGISFDDICRVHKLICKEIRKITQSNDE